MTVEVLMRPEGRPLNHGYIKQFPNGVIEIQLSIIKNPLDRNAKEQQKSL
jgi:hypothetical protein